LEGVEETLEALHGKYKLVVATKGDLLDQRENFIIPAWTFSSHRSDVRQTRIDYSDLIRRLEIKPSIFYDWKFIKI
jgi:putative hydrolase of the HAD superfamily